MIHRLEKFFHLPFIWIMLASLAGAAIFYKSAFTMGKIRGVTLATTLFAQIHFLMAYTFGFNGLKRWVGNSFWLTLGIYALLISVPIVFYPYLLFSMSTFWGLMAFIGYFFLHFFENILYFWEISAVPFHTGKTLQGRERQLFYFFLSAMMFIVILPYAHAYGPAFRGATIRFFDIGNGVYLLAASFVIFVFILLLYYSDQRKSILALCVGSTSFITSFIFLALRFLDFFSLLYFIILWHIFMWHIFYLWKVWKRTRYHLVPYEPSPHQSFDRFLAYATSGPGPFLIITLLFAVPVVGYFLLNYDGSQQKLLFHPFYGQFAMLIWALPHITFSFLPIKKRLTLLKTVS